MVVDAVVVVVVVGGNGGDGYGSETTKLLTLPHRDHYCVAQDPEFQGGSEGKSGERRGRRHSSQGQSARVCVRERERGVSVG